MRLDEFAEMFFIGAGEGTLLMPEEDRFDEIFWQGAAIDGDESATAPIRGALDRAGDDLLADAQFAFQQYRNRRFRGALAQSDHPLHLAASARKITERQSARRLAVEAAHLIFERIDAQRVFDRDLQAFGADRLDDEIKGAGAHRGNHRLDRAMRRLHDRWNPPFLLAQPREDGHTVEIGHHEIEDQEIDRLARGRIEPRERRFAAFGGFRLIAETADESFEQTALHRVIIDDQYETGHGPLS